MIYMLDTADLTAIEKALDRYPIAGVTTNPTIIARENRPFREVILSIRQRIGPQRLLHVQVLGQTAEVMLAEAQAMHQMDPQLVIKVPVTAQGIKAIKLMRAAGFRITATAILTPQQALMAAMAGAEFLAPYVNRLDNIGGHGSQVVADIVHLIEIYGLLANVLAASFKNVQQVHDVAKAGAQSITIGPELLDSLLHHPLTDAGVAGFVRDWESVYGAGKTVVDVIAL